jgi:hypothetical protein
MLESTLIFRNKKRQEGTKDLQYFARNILLFRVIYFKRNKKAHNIDLNYFYDCTIHETSSQDEGADGLGSKEIIGLGLGF